MNSPIDLVLLAWGLVVIATSIVTLGNINQLDYSISTPTDLYNSTDLNWIGVILLYILYLLMFPLAFILKFLYWVFHVGRRSN